MPCSLRRELGFQTHHNSWSWQNQKKKKEQYSVSSVLLILHNSCIWRTSTELVVRGLWDSKKWGQLPNSSCAQAIRDIVGFIYVLSEDSSCQAILGVICPLDDLFEWFKLQDLHDWAKDLTGQNMYLLSSAELILNLNIYNVINIQ